MVEKLNRRSPIMESKTLKRFLKAGATARMMRIGMVPMNPYQYLEALRTMAKCLMSSKRKELTKYYKGKGGSFGGEYRRAIEKGISEMAFAQSLPEQNKAAENLLDALDAVHTMFSCLR